MTPPAAPGDAAVGHRRGRTPMQSTAEAERKLDAICSELMDLASEGIISASRVGEILDWTAVDVRAADRYHRSWSVTEYAKRVGFTRQHVIALINAGKIPGSFKVPTQGDRFEFRIPKENR